MNIMERHIMERYFMCWSRLRCKGRERRQATVRMNEGPKVELQKNDRKTKGRKKGAG